MNIYINLLALIITLGLIGFVIFLSFIGSKILHYIDKKIREDK